MGALLGIVVALVAIGGISAGAVAAGRKGARGENETALAKAGLDLDQQAVLRNADREMRKAESAAYRVQDVELRDGAKQAIAKAGKIIQTFKKQPAEIRRAGQFFNYYLPTITVVLEKYLVLEKEGKADSELLEKTKGYVTEMAHAFDLQFDNMFKDEVLDLTVEVEAMEMALKRDGLS